MITDTGAAEDLQTQKRVGLLKLAVTVLLIAGVTMAFHKGGAVIVVTAILAMIMFHEFGHFITARWAGMKVTDFFVGFGPVLWATRRGETRYGVRALPLGGYVRVIGMSNIEEVAPEDENRTYRAKSYWQRVRFACAGTATHFLIAFILMVVVLAGFGRIVKTVPTTSIDAVTKTFSGVASPAAAAGLKSGDKVVAVNGETLQRWTQLATAINGAPNRRLQLTVQRGDSRFDVSVVPTPQTNPKGQTVGVIGIRSGVRNIRKTVSLPVAVWQAGFEMKSMTVDSAGALVGLFSKSNVKHYGKQLTEHGPADPAPNKDGNRLLSFLGLFRLADFVAKEGVASVLMLLIGLNIFIGIFNMVPLPPFDGGHVAVATYEAFMGRVKGRRHMLDMNKMLPIAYAVVAALVLLSLSAFYLDLMHPFKLG